MIIFSSFILSLIIVYFSIKVSFKFNIVDSPCGRKVHTAAKPRFGGLGIFMSFIIMYLIMRDHSPINTFIMSGGCVIFITGALDDILELKARTKFLVQLVVAIFVVYNGVRFEYISDIFTGGFWNLGIFGSILSVIWIVGIINAVNLIDGLDGLSGGVVIISAIMLTFNFLIQGKVINSMLLILIGSTLGFLMYNFHPSKTFMGDSGSLFLGYMLAVLSISTFTKNITLVSIASPILVMGIPIFDTLFAMIRRISKGEHVFSPDRGHLHHKLLDKGYSHRQVVVMIWILSAFLGVTSLALSAFNGKVQMVIFSILTIIVTLIANYIQLIDFKIIYENIKNRIFNKNNNDLRKEL